MSTLKTTNIAHPSSASNNIVLDSSGNVVLQAGTAAAPALQPSGDTNTGVLFPAADTVAISTGGSERARCDSSGRLLVGTSSASSGSFGQYSYLQIKNNTFGSSAAGAITLLGGGNTSSIVSGTTLGRIIFGDNQTGEYALIECSGDAAAGTNDYPGRLIFSTTADGASSPTERMRISEDGTIRSARTYNNTTATAANMVVQADGQFSRSTSSAKYKTNIETLQDVYADAVLNCRPVWYRSTCKADRPEYGWWGFIAEEVAEIDPRLVYWKTVEITYDKKGSAVETPCEPEPEGVAYDRFVPHLLNLIKRQKEQIESLETRLTAAGI